jgi:2-methylcitrate dehydratase
VTRHDAADTDNVLDSLVAFATRLEDDDIPAAAADRLLDHTVDAFGCAIAAVNEAPSVIARTLAASTSSETGASVIGLAHRTTPELATFANAAMVRQLDYNDTYNSRSGGHPSDMIPAFIAAAESAGRSPRSVLRGAYVAYEVFGALCDSTTLRDRGWDHGAFIAIACAAGLVSVLGLDAAQAANAISLTATTSVPLRITRSGALSEWKGCATAHSALNATILTRLAGLGMTGPGRPFTGVDGFLHRVAEPLNLGALGRPVDGRSVVERTSLKSLPVEYAAQAPIEMFLDLSRELDADDVASITISAHRFLYKEIGGGRDDARDKWDPQTRETADHSFPYLTAVALTDRAVTLDSFTMERVLDPALRPLMNRISIVERPDAADLDPTRQPVDATIELRDGTVIRRSCEFSRGHPSNPASPAEVDAKFRKLAERILPSGTDDMLAALRALPEASDLEGLTGRLRAVPTAAR